MTNWSVQKKHSNFGAHEDGNTWTMKQFQNYLSTIENVNFDDVKFKIEEMELTSDRLQEEKSRIQSELDEVSGGNRDHGIVLGKLFLL